MDTVGKNTKAIAEYIKHQLDENRMGEQMTMLGKSNDNPFTGGRQQTHAIGRPSCAWEGASEEQRAMPAYEKSPGSAGGSLL